MTDITSDLSANVAKLVELSKQLKEAKSDIKVLNLAEKQLKETIKRICSPGHRHDQSP